MNIDPSWWVDIGPNGGYLAAVLSRAAELEATRLGNNHRPASASIHYLRPPRVGLAIVSARLIRSGGALPGHAGALLARQGPARDRLRAGASARCRGCDRV